jgi:hypothetical protein
VMLAGHRSETKATAEIYLNDAAPFSTLRVHETSRVMDIGIYASTKSRMSRNNQFAP